MVQWFKNLPANAGDIGFASWSGKIPHAMEQLSPCTTSSEATVKSPGTAATEPSCHKY